MSKYLTSGSVLLEIGERLKAYRIDYPLSQKELSLKSGVSQRSILRMEKGEDIQFGNLIKILIALDIDANLDMLVPDPTKRPSYYLKEKISPPQRKRAGKKGIKGPAADIRWGEDK